MEQSLVKSSLTNLRQTFRDFYGALSIEELATNKKITHSIERIERLFRKLLE